MKNSKGKISGNLKYEEPGKIKVDSTGITSLSISGNSATFSGPCTVDKQSGYSCTVDITDNGNSNDFFRIRVSNGYEASGTVGSGNIKVHK